MNKPIEKKRLISILLVILFSLMSSAAVVYAAVLFSFRVKGDIGGNTDNMGQNGSLISLETQTENIAFSAGNTEHTIPLAVSNKSSVNAVYDFGVTVTKNGEITDDDFSKLKSSILVSLDGKFIGTLAELTNAGEGNLYNGSFYLASGSATTPTSASHTLALSLHIAADPAAEGKTFVLRVNTYVRNSDYRKVVFVKTENEFKKAADDLNSGLSDVETIVLAGDVTLGNSYSLDHPVSIDLCGHKLSATKGIDYTGKGKLAFLSSGKGEIGTDLNGTVTVNNADAYLDVAGKTESGLSVTLTSFNIAEAKKLVTARAGEILQGQAEGGKEISLFGALSFYNEKIAVTASGSGNYTYTLNGTKLAVNKLAATKPDSVTIGGETIEFKIIGNSRNDSVFASLFADTNGELRHIPTYNNATGAITYDLFLPVYIESKNVKIEWTSSDPSSIGNDGKLADTLNENVEVTLYARITVNEETYLHSFTFKVTSQTRETKFKYLVAQLSPITLRSVYKNDAEKACLNTGTGEGKIKTPYVYLPVVSANGYYDYRKDFHMSHSSDGAPIEAENWAHFRDIGLTNITYKVQNAYNFISLDTGSAGIKAVYLNTATFYTFAQIDVTGDFGYNSSLGKNETYEATVNVLIELGSNSDLYDLAIDHVEKQASEIDILQNILDTRVKYGMGNERGDFYLPSVYQTIAISYSKIGNDAVSDIKPETDENGVLRYHFYINAEEFLSSESSVGIKVTVKMNGDQTSTGQSRNIYVNAPAVIKPDENGFSNYSVFSSAKYQTFSQLADYEKADSSAAGYTGTTDPDATARAARLALLPQKGLTGYSTGFVIAGETITNKTGDYILVRDAEQEGVKNLTFTVADLSGEKSNSSVYRFVQLLNWATGSEKTTLPFTVTGFSSDSGSSNYVQSDGKEYLTEKEVSVIKTYLKNSVGFNDDEIAALWSANTTTAPGMVITNGAKLTEKANELINAAGLSGGGYYFKYNEVMQWALNERDFPKETDAAAGPPDGDQIRRYDIDFTGKGSPSTSHGFDRSLSPSQWTFSTYKSTTSNCKYHKEPYSEDNTSYISQYEAECIISFWAGLTGVNNTTANVARARAFGKVFLANTEIPTYLNSDGAQKLIRAIYAKKNSSSDFTATLDKEGIPYVTNLDYSLTGISYYENLNSIRLSGHIDTETKTVIVPAFITSQAVNNAFDRITSLDSDIADLSKKLQTFTMRACAEKNTAFDLTYISRLTAIKNLDLSYNKGITTIGDLLNLEIKSIKSLNVYNVYVENEFIDYVLKTIKTNNSEADLIYEDPVTKEEKPYTTSDVSSDALRFLNELTRVDSPYLQLAKKSYTSAGSSSTIQWYLQSGNPAERIAEAGYKDVSTIPEMNRLLSNYYVCLQDVSLTYEGKSYNLQANKIYKIYYSGTETTGMSFSFEEVQPFTSVETIPGNDDVFHDSSDSSTIEVISTTGEPDRSDLTEEELKAYADQKEGGTPDYTDLTVSGTGTGYNNHLDFNNGSPYWIGYVNQLYRINKTVDVTTTYRYYPPDGKISSTKYYLNQGKIIKGNYTSNKYIEFSITEKRTYTLYYVRLSSSQSSVSATDKFILILSDTVTTKTSENNDPRCTVDFSKFYEFTYQTGTSYSETYRYREDGHAIYSGKGVTAATLTKTRTPLQISATTDTSSASAEIKTYLDSLNESGDVFNDNITDNSSSTTSEYLTYVKQINTNTDIQTAISSALSSFYYKILYRYTGNSGSEQYYVEGTATTGTYAKNQTYQLLFSSGTGTTSGYSFSTYTLTGKTMEEILNEANLHKTDALFGNYYGNYYCYAGATAKLSNGHVYTAQHVYRLLYNETNGFYFSELSENLQTFDTFTNVDDMLTKLVNNYTSTKYIGRFCYLTTSNTNMKYEKGLYVVDYNNASGTYYYKSAGDIKPQLTVDGNGFDPSRLQNIRYTSDSTFTSGKKGTATIYVYARVIETVTENDGTVKKIYERPFKVTVSG